MNIFFGLVMEYHPKKKLWDTASLRIAHDEKFSSFKYLLQTPSPNKTNKFIPYHLIISKYKYYVIKHYTFLDLQ
jgi:hypothetical protein